MTLFHGQLQRTDVAGGMQAAGHLVSILRCFDHLLVRFMHLLGSQDFKIVFLNLGGQGDNLGSNPQFGAFELDGGQFFTGGKHQKIEKILGNSEFKIGHSGISVRKAHPAEDHRILQQTGFDHIRLSDPQLLVGCLQAGIVQQRNLDHRLRRQFVFDHSGNYHFHFGIGFCSLVPVQAIIHALSHDFLDIAEAGVLGELGTA